jgi:hypothetical protein
MAIALWQTNHKNAAEISVSGERKINLRTSFLTPEVIESRLEIKATWKDTKIWLAMTQPFSREDFGESGDLRDASIFLNLILPVAKDRTPTSAVTTLNFLITSLPNIMHMESKSYWSLGASRPWKA